MEKPHKAATLLCFKHVEVLQAGVECRFTGDQSLFIVPIITMMRLSGGCFRAAFGGVVSL